MRQNIGRKDKRRRDNQIQKTERNNRQKLETIDTKTE